MAKNGVQNVSTSPPKKIPGVPGIGRGESAAADTAAGVGEAGHGLNDQSSGGGSGGGNGMFGQ